MNAPPRRRFPFLATALLAVLFAAAPAARADDPLPTFGLADDAAAPKGSADVSAQLDASAVPAGGTATIAVIVDVHDKLHAQSHTPGGENLPLIVTAKTTAAGVTFGDVRYPPGKDVTYPDLGTLNVYVGRAIAYVPVTVAKDAKPGPVQITGVVELQACNDKMCFPPEKVKFTVKTTVVAAGAAVEKAHPELFTGPAMTATSQPAVAPATAAPPPPSAGAGEPDWFARHLKTGGLPFALAAAFAIGVLFNAVPCVLPVIPLKVLGFYEVSKHDRGKCLLLGSVFGAGIVTVFLALGVLIAGLHWIDWGSLFQQTWFTAVITLVLLGAAAGTFGLFDVALPNGVYGFDPRHDNVTGNYLFGMFTAVLSTPCTFGLLTVLLTWALKLTAPAAVGIFVVIGAGMAAPYVLLSAFPEVARRMPRSGPWSAVMKQTMGLLMVATAVFFAQPLLVHVMPIEATWWLLFATVAVTAAFLLVQAVRLSGLRLPTLVAGAAAVAMVAVSLGVTLRLTRWPYQWQPYTPAALAAAQAAGHPVVIDFTAAWCSTCHGLEATTLHDQRVVSAVRDHKAVMLRADVTHGNEAGKPLLDQLNPGTKSIPFTAVYGPHAAADGKPVTLNGIYSADDLVGSLKQVTGG